MQIITEVYFQNGGVSIKEVRLRKQTDKIRVWTSERSGNSNARGLLGNVQVLYKL
jgi:hypothetical protein